MAKCTQCNNNEATRGLLCEDCIRLNQEQSQNKKAILRAELKIPKAPPPEKLPGANPQQEEPEQGETAQERLALLLLVVTSPRAAFFSISRYVRMQEAFIAASIMLVGNALYVLGSQQKFPKGLLIILLLAGVAWFLLQMLCATLANFVTRLFGKRLPFWCVFNLIGVAFFPYSIAHFIFNVVALRFEGMNPGLVLTVCLLLLGAFFYALMLTVYGLRIIPSEDHLQELLSGGGPTSDSTTATEAEKAAEPSKQSATSAEPAESNPEV